MAHSKKDKLVKFLDEKAFEPILKTSAREYDKEREKKMLQHVKRSTRSEKDRYENRYRTASEVRSRYLDDLNSKPAQRVNRELKELDLPRLPDIKDQFLRLCDQLGVK